MDGTTPEVELTPLLSYNIWLSLPAEVRTKLVKMFGIPRTGEVVVTSGQMMNGNIGSFVKQDGHSAKDLYAISVEKMQELLKDSKTEDFYKLFKKTLKHVDALADGTYKSKHDEEKQD